MQGFIDEMGYEETDKLENTQPISNRREKEQYPRYIKYIPTEKLYISGKPETDKFFWFLKVNTLPAEEDEITPST